MIVSNEEVKGVVVEIPEGHRHLRTTIVLQDGRKFTFQEDNSESGARLHYCQNASHIYHGLFDRSAFACKEG
jgi:hypothetical protein